MKKIIWIFINCNSAREADRIGLALLKKRMISCFDILPRLKTSYFWPPKSGKIESGKGAILVGETLPKNFLRLHRAVKALHSDKLPFIGAFDMTVEDKYYTWLKGEVQ